MSDDPLRLAPHVEELLQAMPTPERGDWEALAQQIDQRVRETEAKSTAPLWLMAPLPDEAHEPGAQAQATPSEVSSEVAASDAEGAPAAPTARADVAAPAQTPTTSLADLARSVAQKNARPEAANIAKESISLAAAARVHTDGMVERVRSARPASARLADAGVPPAPPSTRVAPAVATSPARRSELGPWIAIGGLGAALAAALMVIAFRREPAQIVVAAPPAATVSAAGVPQAPLRVEPPRATAPRREETARAESAGAPVAASALPLSPKSIPSTAAPRAGSESLAVAARTPNTSVARPEPEQIKLEETPAPSKQVAEAPSTPSNAMRPAAGSASSGGLPDRPSTGAVQAAIGSVMSSARACVAGGVATPAQITFGSNGSVSSVSVTGPAAGTATASCIDAALKRARVAPFTNQSFSLNIWVRP